MSEFEFFRTSLKRSASCPLYDSSNSDEDLKILNKTQKFEDPGYTREKKIAIKHRILEYKPYTEDRSWNSIITIGHKKYTIMSMADGHGSIRDNSYKCSKFIMGRIVVYSDIISVESSGPADFLARLFVFLERETNIPSNKISLCGTGTTLCVGLIDIKDHICWVGNLGDSVCQVIRNDPLTGLRTQIFRTIDHDAGSIKEQDRIKLLAPRSYFTTNGVSTRLNGRLMVVGGFGDWDLETAIGVIRRKPDISSFQLNKHDVVIISSDGLFEKVYGGKIGIGPGRHEDEVFIAEDVEMFFRQDEEKSLSKFLHNNHINRMTKEYLITSGLDSDNSNNLEKYKCTITSSNDNNAILTHII